MSLLLEEAERRFEASVVPISVLILVVSTTAVGGSCLDNHPAGSRRAEGLKGQRSQLRSTCKAKLALVQTDAEAQLRQIQAKAGGLPPEPSTQGAWCSHSILMHFEILPDAWLKCVESRERKQSASGACFLIACVCAACEL